jgi:hypothetical protein
MPNNAIDRVHFSVTSPAVLVRGSTCVVDVWAHLGQQREDVIQRAREEAAGSAVRIKSKGPVKVARGRVLTVRLRLEDFTVEPLVDTILWEGEVGNATFSVSVPESAAVGSHSGVATVHLDGIQVARVTFAVLVDQQSISCKFLSAEQRRHRTAFASYAHEDRDAMLARIQGIQKGAPDLDIFLDVASLRSGEHWQERLNSEIVRRDVFYLFWSAAASRSEWVNWEWRCALRERGIDFIDPCPLEPPDQIPPPRELADRLHFNDWTLAYRGTAGDGR